MTNQPGMNGTVPTSKPKGKTAPPVNPPASDPARPSVTVNDPADKKGRLKHLGGSASDAWNSILANQAISTLWLAQSDADEKYKQYNGTVHALVGLKPADEIEGMLAAQMLAAHSAAMECYRRAMIPEQPSEGREQNLSQANKLSRTHAALVDALNRHRGKGQQKVTVEHVHVHKGGQAIVGNVTTPGGGVAQKTEEQPHALGYAPGAPMRRADEERYPVPVAGDAERPMPDARRPVAGSAEG